MQIGSIYYIIPDVFKKKFSFIKFLRHIKRRHAVSYLKSCLTYNREVGGGTKIFYQHVVCLRELGYDAHILALSAYDGNVFYPDIKSKFVSDTGFELNENDIVVATEFCPYDALKFKNPVKIMFAQSWCFILNRKSQGDRTKSYRDLGYDHVISCGAYIADFIQSLHSEECVAIQNGVDNAVFYQDETLRIENRILCLTRKNFDDTKHIMSIVKREVPEANFVLVDGLSEKELAEEYRKSDIFLATGYPEGLPLPPLEAISSGCAVVGFAGRGGREYLIHNKTALIAEDGDVVAAADYLIKLLKNKSLKEAIREAGSAASGEYTIAKMKNRISKYYQTLEFD